MYLYCIHIFLYHATPLLISQCIFAMFQGSADVVYVDMRWDGNDLSVALFANDDAGPPLNTPVLVPFTGEWSYTSFRVPRLNTDINCCNDSLLCRNHMITLMFPKTYCITLYIDAV